MKRLGLGTTVLLILLLVGIGVAFMLQTQCNAVSRQLQQAAQLWQQGQVDQAVQLAQSAAAQWQQRYTFTAAVTDHGPLENIQELFAQLPVWAQHSESHEFAALCAALAQLVDGVGGSAWPSLYNIF